MVNRVKLTNTQLNKLKSAAKNKTRTVLRITKDDEKLSGRCIASWIITKLSGNYF